MIDARLGIDPHHAVAVGGACCAAGAAAGLEDWVEAAGAEAGAGAAAGAAAGAEALAAAGAELSAVADFFDLEVFFEVVAAELSVPVEVVEAVSAVSAFLLFVDLLDLEVFVEADALVSVPSVDFLDLEDFFEPDESVVAAESVESAFFDLDDFLVFELSVVSSVVVLFFFFFDLVVLVSL